MHTAGLPRRRGRHPQRVVVIGAGHNGLVCAVELAAAGLDVCVVEQADHPGGAVWSAEAPAGFVHDTCSGFFPLARASPALRRLPLEDHGLEWIAPEVAMVHPFLDGGEIALHRDLERTVASLEALAPGSGNAWRAVIGPALGHAQAVADAGLQRFPPTAAAARAVAGLRRDGLELVRRCLMAPAALGRELSADDRLGAWIANSAMHSDLTADKPGGAAFALVLHLLGHHVGWPIVRGGAGNLTRALASLLDAGGGELRCGARVARIESDDRVRAVHLTDGERLAADAVVCTLSAGALAPLLDDALPGRLMRRLRTWRYGPGTFKTDFALGGPVPWTAPTAREAGVIHLGDTLSTLRESGHELGMGRVPRALPLIVGQHTRHDPSRAPAGGHTLYTYFRCPPEPAADDAALADLVEERIEAFAPGFRSLVLSRATRSSRQMETDNPSLIDGDLAGGSAELDQQLVFRPAPELFRQRAPLPGLYLAGSSTHPGPGVHGASGAGAARALLADRSPLRFWR